jgi:hypothetical protein
MEELKVKVVEVSQEKEQPFPISPARKHKYTTPKGKTAKAASMGKA